MSDLDVIYQYDGTFAGFLCCIYDSYAYKESPVGFSSDEGFLSLYEVRTVPTSAAHSKRVYQGIFSRSAQAAKVLRRAFLTCMEDKEMHLYAFACKVLREGGGFMGDLSDPVYYPLHKALRHMSGELEKLRGFVRFSDYHGVLGAAIEPKNRVLPLLRHHFCERYANETFFIFDRTNREVLFHAQGRARIVPMEHLELAAPDETELQYRQLWKTFFETVAIKERRNPRCQNSFLPKRYRGVMTEFLPLDGDGAPCPLDRSSRGCGPERDLPVNRSAAPAASVSCGAPCGIPAPAKRAGAGRSAPASSP